MKVVYTILFSLLLQFSCITLPVPDNYVTQKMEDAYSWIKKEPLLEAFPVSIDYVVSAPLPQEINGIRFLMRYPEGYQSTYKNKLNHIYLEQVNAKLMRESIVYDKNISVRNRTYQEDGTGEAIMDTPSIKIDFNTKTWQSIPLLTSGVPANCFNAASASHNETQTAQIKSLFFHFKSTINITTNPDYYCIRDIHTNQVVAGNLDGMILFPQRPLHIGDQWEFEVYYTAKTTSAVTSPKFSQTLHAGKGVLMLITYQLAGFTDCENKRCAVIEMFGQSYEMDDWAGQSSYYALKKIAATLSKKKFSEIQNYLKRRKYSDNAMQGSFQITSKFSGYTLFSYRTGETILWKMGYEGGRGGAAKAKAGAIGVSNTSKGIIRQQIIITKKTN